MWIWFVGELSARKWSRKKLEFRERIELQILHRISPSIFRISITVKWTSEDLRFALTSFIKLNPMQFILSLVALINLNPDINLFTLHQLSACIWRRQRQKLSNLWFFLRLFVVSCEEEQRTIKSAIYLPRHHSSGVKFQSTPHCASCERYLNKQTRRALLKLYVEIKIKKSFCLTIVH